ncbi:MAG: hypothetical protein ACRDVP_03895 [Acidimicrobiales bacterium]
MRAAEEAARRKRRNIYGLGAAVIVVVGIIVAIVVTSSGGAKPPPRVQSQAGPEGIPIERGTPIAPASTSANGATVEGIQCQASEQVAYHIHAHLAIYVNGTLRPLPAGIGLVSPLAQPTADGNFYEATHCYYWLHVHAQDGVIHIESPAARAYTLGQFFAIWNQPLGPGRVAGVTGTLHVFVNGKARAGDPSQIVLLAHTDIQIDVGTPVVAPRSVDWTGTGL